MDRLCYCCHSSSSSCCYICVIIGCRSRDLVWIRGVLVWELKHWIARRQHWYVLQQSVCKWALLI